MTEFDNDPVFNQLRRVSETEAFEPVFTPPPDGGDPRTWLVPSAEFEAHSDWNVFDYQEPSEPVLPPGLQYVFGYNFSQLLADRAARGARWAVDFGLGDRNRDGQVLPPRPVLFSEEGVRGVVVEARQRPARHADGSTRPGYMRTQYNTRGQVTVQVDPVGVVTRRDYYPPDPTPYHPASGAHAGYLRQFVVDDDPVDWFPREGGSPPVRATTTLRYDRIGRADQVTSPLGSITATAWDPDGVPLEVRRGVEDGGPGYLSRTEYDGALRPVRLLLEDRGGHNSEAGRSFEERRAYDALGELVEEAVHLDGAVWLTTRHTYDPEQLLVATTRPAGNRVEWAYDARGLRTTEHRGAGTPEQSERAWSYDPSRLPIELRLPDGDLVLYRYDRFNRLSETVAPNGAVERRRYDPVGQLARVERWGRPGGPTPRGNDESGNVLLAATDFVRDARRRVREERQELFGAGLATAVVVTRTEYDALDRPVRQLDPAGNATTVELDGLGRVVSVADALGNAVLSEYDAMGNLLRRREVDPGVDGLRTASDGDHLRGGGLVPD